MKVILLSAWLCVSLMAAGMNENMFRPFKDTADWRKEAARFFSASGERGVLLSEKVQAQSAAADSITLEASQSPNEYGEDESVRVRIVFDEKALETSSMDELIERISEEALAGEALDVRRTGIGGNGISAYLAYGRMEAVRALEYVESVELEKQYELHDPTSASEEESGEASAPQSGTGQEDTQAPDASGEETEGVKDTEPSGNGSEESREEAGGLQESEEESEGLQGSKEEAEGQKESEEPQESEEAKPPGRGEAAAGRIRAAAAVIGIGAAALLAGCLLYKKRKKH